MSETAYPDMINNLPDLDIDNPLVRGKLLQAEDKQIVFFELEAGGAVPPHSHGAQWGIVVEGELEFTIGGETRVLGKGDAYFIPDGIEHSVKVRAPSKAVDFFDEPARHRAKR